MHDLRFLKEAEVASLREVEGCVLFCPLPPADTSQTRLQKTASSGFSQVALEVLTEEPFALTLTDLVVFYAEMCSPASICSLSPPKSGQWGCQRSFKCCSGRWSFTPPQ